MDDFNLHFFNVGNADTIGGVLHSEDFYFLIDVVDAEKIATSLEQLPNKELNFILISHSDFDHISGLYQLIENYGFRTKILYINYDRSPASPNSKEYLKILKQLQLWKQYYDFKIRPAYAETILVESSLKIEILHPEYEFLGRMHSIGNHNDASVVVKLDYKDKSILLTGDIQEKGIEEIVTNYPNMLVCDALKIPHHGSYPKNAAFEKLVSTAKPKYAIISCGPNSYGHPDNNVMSHLTSKGIDVFLTEDCKLKYNSILVAINNDGCQVNYSNLNL
jgi:competence protein ComEC